MGISGLLPLLKSIQRPTELKKFSGETLGVDAYGWLHRGAISCAVDLAHGKPTRKYVDFAMYRVRMAKHFGVTPYLVFDGDFLPSKAMTEASRAKRRDESKKAGLELLKAGKQSQAFLELQKAIDVTPEMARHLIDQLKSAGVPYVVAPYEADAQLVYLERQGIISGIISEDSDLLVFGAKRLLTKLDQHGRCIEINRRDFCACREISLTGWTDSEFRQMAIFSGCDYLDGINNMGLKTAYRMIRKYKTPERVVQMLQFDGKHRVSENYLAAFKQAELTFLHQRVFCPTRQQLVLLTEADSAVDIGNMPFIGADLEASLARAIALGDVNPITKKLIVVEPTVHRRDGHPRRQAAVQSRPTGKPIDSYFKGDRRIPLGEMDPNCFSVDSRQVARITMNGLLPRVFPLPRPYVGDDTISATQPPASRVLRRRTEPVTNIIGHGSASPSRSRRRTAGPVLPGPTDSERPDAALSSRPPKKARLCNDIPGKDSHTAQRLETSRFFPLDQARATRSAKSESYLMSDDSVEEALLSLPDVDRWNSPRVQDAGGGVRIFEESQETGDTTSASTSDPPNAGGPICTDVVEIPGPLSPRQANNSDGEETTLSETPIRPSLQQFTYAAKKTTRFNQGLPTPASSVASASSVRQQAPDPSREPLSLSGTPLLTPLQRIGHEALHRSASPGRLPSTPQSSGRRRSRERKGGWQPSRSSLPLNPSFVPLPKVDLAEVEALNRPLGSEDQIIPDSDGENEPASLDEHGKAGKIFNAPPSTMLDLSRFLYI